MSLVRKLHHSPVAVDVARQTCQTILIRYLRSWVFLGQLETTGGAFVIRTDPVYGKLLVRQVNTDCYSASATD